MDLEQVLKAASQELLDKAVHGPAAKAILSHNGVGLVFVKLLAADIQAAQGKLARADLTSDEGVKSAIGVQQEIRGLNRAIETLISLANGEIEDD